jgi:hypothetical protein
MGLGQIRKKLAKALLFRSCAFAPALACQTLLLYWCQFCPARCFPKRHTGNSKGHPFKQFPTRSSFMSGVFFIGIDCALA